MVLISRMVCVVAMLVVAAPRASADVIDFDALDASGGHVGGAQLAAYFAQYGVTYTYTPGGCCPTANLYVADEDNIYGGGVILPSSGENVLLSVGNSAQPGQYQLFFSAAQDYVAFTRTALIAPSIYPQWQATAYVGATPVGSVGEGSQSGTFGAQTFTLGTAGDSLIDITSLLFTYNGSGNAAFDSPVIDDLVLPNSTAVPEPATLLLVGSGLAGLAYKRRRRESAQRG